MRKMIWIVLLGLLLGGCTWMAPPEEEFFPEEIVPGWQKEAQGLLPLSELPVGASGGWGATWKSAAARLWAEVVTMADAQQAASLFRDIQASLHNPEQDQIGDEGVRAELRGASLVLHLFRVGPSLVLVGSLARTAADAPPAGLVRQAALNIVGKLPYLGSPQVSWAQARSTSTAQTVAPAAELRFPLRNEVGQVVGAVSLRVYGYLAGESAGDCHYRLSLHLAKIEVSEALPDGPLRGPLDLFLAGLLELPCGRLTFITPELAYLQPGEEKTFDAPGPFLGELECFVPCSLPSLPLNMNVILRDHDNDLLDFLRAFVLWLGQSDPKAAALEGMVEEIVGLYGPKADNPPDPISAAQNFPGTTLGGGSGGYSLPTEIIYGGVKFEFFGQLAIPGSCSLTPQKAIWCRVPEGASGVLTLQAKRIPAGAVNIRAETLPPGWPAFPVASGWGTITSQYSFTVPMGTASQRFVLRFRAWTPGVVGELEVQVILDVVPQEAG